MWCPATALAWQRFSPHGPTLLAAASLGSVADSATPHFLHQAAYLHCTLVHVAELAPERAANRLIQALRAYQYNQEPDAPEADEDEEQVSAQPDEPALTVWDPTPRNVTCAKRCTVLPVRGPRLSRPLGVMAQEEAANFTNDLYPVVVLALATC